MDITVVSGAVGAVAPTRLAQEYRARPSARPRNGATYRTASGKKIANQGGKRIMVRTEEGETRTVVFQIADITQTV